MGAQIDIRLESDKDDKSNSAPFIGRDFVYEIAKGYLWHKKTSFLTATEEKLLEAPLCDFDDEQVKPVDPQAIVDILTKVNTYLMNNEPVLPYTIDLDIDLMNAEGLSTALMVNGSRCWIKGDEVYNPDFAVVNIVNLPGEPNNVDIWIDAKSEFEIEGRKYYLTKTSRYKKYADLIQRIIDFCNYAISRNEKIYWMYRH